MRPAFRPCPARSRPVRPHAEPQGSGRTGTAPELSRRKVFERGKWGIGANLCAPRVSACKMRPVRFFRKWGIGARPCSGARACPPAGPCAPVRPGTPCAPPPAMPRPFVPCAASCGAAGKRENRDCPALRASGKNTFHHAAPCAPMRPGTPCAPLPAMPRLFAPCAASCGAAGRREKSTAGTSVLFSPACTFRPEYPPYALFGKTESPHLFLIIAPRKTPGNCNAAIF